MLDFLYAADAVANTSSTQAGNPLASFLPLILLFVIFYFFLIRPQQKRAKEHQNMINSLNKGDIIITSGGILGQIVGLKDGMIEVKIAENVNIKMTKESVSKKVTAEQEAAQGE